VKNSGSDLISAYETAVSKTVSDV
ncbi:MAG: hypothetical protein RLZZ51_1112, partial [Actinomycetota bacterium]